MRDEKRQRSTHPLVVKDAPPDLSKDVARGSLERSIDIRAALSARLDEEEALLLRPALALVRGHLPPFVRKVTLIADEDARQVWVRVRAYVRKPGACVVEAWAWFKLRRKMGYVAWVAYWVVRSRRRRGGTPRRHGSMSG